MSTIPDAAPADTQTIQRNIQRAFPVMDESRKYFDESNALRHGAIGRLPLIALGVLAVVAVLMAIWLTWVNKPSPADAVTTPHIDAARFDLYRPGLHLRTHANVTVQGRVIDKDWALGKEVSFAYISEGALVRSVKSNDGNELRVEVKILTARNLSIKATVENLRFDPPDAAVTIFTDSEMYSDVVLMATGAEYAKSLIRVLESGYVKDGINWLIKQSDSEEWLAENILGKSEINEMEGKQATAHYRNGEGLVELDSEGNLSARQEELLRRINIVSEAHLLPDLNAEPGDTWTVDARHLAMLIDPGISMQISGSVEFRRKPNEDDRIRFKAIGGVIAFEQLDTHAELLGRWSPRGSLLYDPAMHTVVEGRLTGKVQASKVSRDHILFEAQWTGEPNYVVTISGFSTTDRVEAYKRFTAPATSE